MQLVEHPHSNIFLLKTNLLQLMVDVIKYSPNASVTMFCLAIFIHLIFFWSCIAIHRLILLYGQGQH